MRSSLTLLAFTVLTACTGEVALTPTSTHGTGGASSTTGTGGAGGAVDPLALTGTFFNTWITDIGDVVLPQDPTTVTLSAMVQRSDGGWDTYPGTLDASGSFTIPGVPLGTAYIVARQLAYDWAEIEVTSQRTVALTRARFGRPDAVRRTQETPIALQLSGTEGWDEAMILSIGAGAYLGIGCTGGCADVPVSKHLQFATLVDATRGDETWALHSGLVPGAPGAHVIDSAFHSTTFTQHDGVPSTLSGTAMPVPLQHVPIAFDATAFSALPDGAPQGTASTAVWVMVGPQLRDPAVPLLLGELDQAPVGDGSIDMVYGALDTGWPLQGWLEVQSATSLHDPAHPGATGQAWGTFDVFGPLAALTKEKLSLPLGLPRDLRVNGEPAFAALTGVGTSPTISWSAPAVGTPDGYRVFLASSDHGATTGYAVLHTADPQIVVPPGILYAGENTIFLEARAEAPQSGLTWEATVSGGSFVP